MKQSANVSGLRSHRSSLTALVLIAALAVSLALYLGLSARPAHALDCGYEQIFIRNDGGQHKAQRLPIFAPDCTEVGWFIDSFLGPGEVYVIEHVNLLNAEPNTTYQWIVEVRFPTASGECPTGPPVVSQPGPLITTNPDGKANEVLQVEAPGEAGSPIPPEITGQYLCYTYVFEPIDGGDVLETPQTLAYIDRPAEQPPDPQGGPKFE
jgi:hypothetical protein